MKYKEILNEHGRIRNERDVDDFGRYDPNEDHISKPQGGATRKPSLTLAMVNRLKKIRSTKDLEMVKKKELLGIMYGLGAAAEE